jgi:hypothetical protein
LRIKLKNKIKRKEGKMKRKWIDFKKKKKKGGKRELP